MVSRNETVDLKHLRLFALAARNLSLTAAARALDVPKSTVSKAIAELERRLGVRLMERSSRRVAVTRAGAHLLARTDSILAEVDQLAADMRDETHLATGAVRLSAPPELGTRLAAEFAPAVLAAHPRLVLTLGVDYAFDDLLLPEVDLAFRVGTVHDDRLVARALGQFRRLLVASPEYVHSRRVREPADLERCNCLTFGAGAPAAKWAFERRRADRDRGEGSIDIAVRGNFAAHSFVALLAAARAGLGVARVPDFVAGDPIRRGELVQVLPLWSAPPSTVYLVHRFGHERVGRVRLLIDEALARMPALLAEGALPATRRSRRAVSPQVS